MEVEPQPAPTWINASQPSRTAPLHSSVASFGKNGIEYRQVPLAAPKLVPARSVWPSLNEAQEICDSLTIPKTAKNLKPLKAPKVPAPIKPTADPFDSYEKAAQAVSKMMKLPVASSSKGKGRLVTRIRTPPFYPSPDLEHFENYEQSGFDWAADHQRNFAEEYREYSWEPSVSLGEESIRDEEYNFDESDDSEGATCQLGFNKIWHKCLGHPSKDVLKRAKELKDFPNDLVFPEHSPLCRGCAEGKMHSKSFPESDSQASKLFQLMHSDLKEFPVESYSKYIYIITFLDDYSSHAWIALLRKKSQTLTAFKHFDAMVRNQFKVAIGTLMSDFGGEYKSKDFDLFLKEKGIQSHTSVPHIHQQNGHAEHFNRTLMDKA